MIEAELEAVGLIVRGSVVFEPDEAFVGRSGLPATSVVLIGTAGARYWPHFQRWRESQAPYLRNPLDSWSRLVLERIADGVKARAVFPSDRPYLPFQQWAMHAEGLKPSPLGILMHPEYGLWHAYRGALLFDHAVSMTSPRATHHSCDACLEKPCLKACPVEAHSHAGFDHEGCLTYVRGGNGERCRTAGCFDRNACPVGEAFRYPAEIQAFHMAAFARR